MTGAYIRTRREGKIENIEVEFLTTSERLKHFQYAEKEELLRWIDLLSNTLVSENAEYARFLTELTEDE